MSARIPCVTSSNVFWCTMRTYLVWRHRICVLMHHAYVPCVPSSNVFWFTMRTYLVWRHRMCSDSPCARRSSRLSRFERCHPAATKIKQTRDERQLALSGATLARHLVSAWTKESGTDLSRYAQNTTSRDAKTNRETLDNVPLFYISDYNIFNEISCFTYSKIQF